MPASPPRPPIRLVILDLDGVVYRGDRAVEGAPELVSRLHEAGLAVRYATNNSMFTRAAFAERLRAIGIPADADEIVTSTSATIEHLQRHEPDVRRVLAVGAEGMVAELRAAGYPVVPAGEAAAAGRSSPPRVDAVLVGLDPEFDDARRAAAAGAVRAGARLIATNADERYPTRTGFRPGAGTMVRALEAASGVAATVIGKPGPAMFRAILEAAACSPAAALVVGDSPDSDVVAARRAGIPSVLVLTGVTDRGTAGQLAGERTPDHVAADPAGVWDVVEARLRPSAHRRSPTRRAMPGPPRPAGRPARSARRSPGGRR